MQSPMSELNIVALIGMLVGWAFTIGIMWQMGRNHGDKIRQHDDQIKATNDRIDRHHEDMQMHTGSEWRIEIRETMQRFENKLDKFAAQCLERISKGKC